MSFLKLIDYDISIVLPVLNGAKYIEKAIQSVISQQDIKIDFIILDAGSTDGTLLIIKKYSDYIRYWHSQADGGANEAYNIGLDLAKSEYIGFLNADDFYHQDCLKNTLLSFRLHNADIVTHCVNIEDASGNIREYKNSQVKLSVNNVLQGRGFLSSHFMKKNIITDSGGFRSFNEKGEYLYSADTELLLKIASKNYREVSLTSVGLTYLAHENSATFGKNYKNFYKIAQEHIDLSDRFLERSLQLNESLSLELKKWKRYFQLKKVYYGLKQQNYYQATQDIVDYLKSNNLLVFVDALSVAKKILGINRS